MRIKYSTYLALECLYSMLLFLFNFERYERDESTRAAGAGAGSVAAAAATAACSMCVYCVCVKVISPRTAKKSHRTIPAKRKK